MKLATKVAALVAGLHMLAGATGAQAVESAKLRLAHNLATDHVLARTFDHFAEQVAELSDGAMEVVIYPNGQMGETRDIIAMMQQGAMDMTKGFAGELETFEPSFFVFNVPYLFNDLDHLRDVLYGEIGADLNAQTEGKGFFNLAAYATNPRSFYTNKAIAKPADLEGERIRVLPTPTINRMVELMGGAPAPIPWGETYTAIQQGVISGAENNVTSFVSSRHFEVAKFFSADEHTAVVDYLTFSNLTWDRLSEEQQAILQKAARASERFQQEVYATEVEAARQTALDAGVTFVEVDKESFQAAVQPLIDELMEDPERAEWINRIRAAGQD